MNLEELWKKVLEIIQAKVEPVPYAVWIEPIIPYSMNETEIVLKVDGCLREEIIDKRYKSMIQNAIKDILGKEYNTTTISN